MSLSRPLCIGLFACLTLGAGSAAAVDDLGRLFTNAMQRARIDDLRAGKRPQTDATSTLTDSGRVIVNGTLRGSDGKRLVWLNGATVQPDNAKDLRLLRDGSVKLTWQDRTKILKPGQGVDQVTGEVFEYNTPAPAPVVKESAVDGSAAADAAPPAAVVETQSSGDTAKAD